MKSITSLYWSKEERRDFFNKYRDCADNEALERIWEAKITNSDRLRLWGQKIWSLDPLESLTHLESLDISGTQVNSFNPLKKLDKLKYLDARSTKINDLTPVKKLYKLAELEISNTQVNDLSPISELKQLEILDIRETQVNDLSPISELGLLRILDIQNTKIIDLSPLKKMIRNNVKIIFGSQTFHKKGIFVKGCLINNPPNEIINEGNQSILRFWEQITKQKGTVELYDAKLIIVGEGGTGKTTLLNKLVDPEYKLKQQDETHGINIFEGWRFKHSIIGDKTFYANLWDFGGQEIQYMTHQFFLTPRALYVLMMDARRESPNLAYWFKIISLLGQDRQNSTEKVRLLLVFNKRSHTTGTPPYYQEYLRYYEDSLSVEYLVVDLSENDFRFESLKHSIQNALVTLPIVKSQLPRMWKAVRIELQNEAKKNSYISTKRFSEICSIHGITEEADQWLLSSYLHQLGLLLHFQNDKGLRRVLILQSQWAVDGVYTFLSEESIARNNGRFTENDFMALLAKRNYNREDADVILQLMTKNNFDICYEATEHNYVAAQLLPDNAPLSIKWFPSEVLQFRYQYPIMPKGLMSRLIVRLSDDIERDKESGEQMVWKKGVILHIKLKEGECRVRLREDDAESKSGLRQILIDVMGERDVRKYALRKVRDTVDDLHKKWFRSIKADEMVPCCCSECRISDTPQLYKLDNLLKLRNKGHNIPLRCFDSAEEVSTQDLLEGVYYKNEINEKDNETKYRD